VAPTVGKFPVRTGVEEEVEKGTLDNLLLGQPPRVHQQTCFLGVPNTHSPGT
jgi:hypothetical protein